MDRILYTTRFPLMGGEALVRFVDGRGRERAAEVAQCAEQEARRIEMKYSRYRSQSVLSEINDQAGKSPVVVDDETIMLVRTALRLSRWTGGRFDPTCGVFRRVWDFKVPRVPDPQAIAALRPLVDARAVKVQAGTVFLERPGMELDLGGVGKEYAADRVASLLKREGVESAVINLLGDVRTLGSRGDGIPWVIGVADPQAPERCRFNLRVFASAGIATSGDYARGFTLDGVRYHHILDATTGMPAQGVASVTVVAPSAGMAGQLSTAAFLLGSKEGLALIQRTIGAEGAIIDTAGQIFATPGMLRISDIASTDVSITAEQRGEHALTVS